MAKCNISFYSIDGSTKTPLANVGVDLIDKTGTTVDSATSDSNGLVTFNNINKGNYTLQQTGVPSGYNINPNGYKVICLGCSSIINNMMSNNFKLINNPKTSTITYNPNYPGLTTNSTDTVPTGSPYDAKANMFTSPTNEFVGWNTQPDNTGDSYAPGATLPTNSDITLYAIWKSSVPTLNPISVTDTEITGTGVPGSTITATYPGGTTGTTTVNPDGTYAMGIPGGVTLTNGDSVGVTGTEPNMTESNPTTTNVE